MKAAPVCRNFDAINAPPAMARATMGCREPAAFALITRVSAKECPGMSGWLSEWSGPINRAGWRRLPGTVARLGPWCCEAKAFPCARRAGALGLSAALRIRRMVQLPFCM